MWSKNSSQKTHWLKAASCATIWLALWKDFHFDFRLSLIWSMKSCFYSCKQRRKRHPGGKKKKKKKGKHRESFSGFTGAAGTRETILGQHRKKWCRGRGSLLAICNPKFPVSPAQGITNSVQLRRNLKEPKVVRAAAIPGAEGAVPARLSPPARRAGPDSSFCTPAQPRSAPAVMDESTERQHPLLGSDGRRLFKIRNLFQWVFLFIYLF